MYSDAFTQEMKVALYLAAASFLVSLLTIQRHPPSPMKKVEDSDHESLEVSELPGDMELMPGDQTLSQKTKKPKRTKSVKRPIEAGPGAEYVGFWASQMVI